jgi:hypothetical protein
MRACVERDGPEEVEDIAMQRAAWLNENDPPPSRAVAGAHVIPAEWSREFRRLSVFLQIW